MTKAQEVIKFNQDFHNQLQQIIEKYQLYDDLFDLLSDEEMSALKEIIYKNAKEELKGTVKTVTSGDEYQQAKETRKQSKELVKKLMDLTGKTKQEAEEIVYGKPDQKENFNKSIYTERVSHRHKEISDDDFESLKSLSARYSYKMKGDVKMHQFDQNSFYIPDYKKVDLRYEDMALQEGSTKKNPIKGKRKFENIANSYKMQELAKANGLDISTINFKESLDTFLHLGQAVADAYDMGITFDINFIENNEEQVKRILYGIYTITGQTIIMPYKINEERYVSSCYVSLGIAWAYHFDSRFGSSSLSPFISCRS